MYISPAVTFIYLLMEAISFSTDDFIQPSRISDKKFAHLQILALSNLIFSLAKIINCHWSISMSIDFSKMRKFERYDFPHKLKLIHSIK